MAVDYLVITCFAGQSEVLSAVYLDGMAILHALEKLSTTMDNTCLPYTQHWNLQREATVVSNVLGDKVFNASFLARVGGELMFWHCYRVETSELVE